MAGIPGVLTAAAGLGSLVFSVWGSPGLGAAVLKAVVPGSRWGTPDWSSAVGRELLLWDHGPEETARRCRGEQHLLGSDSLSLWAWITPGECILPHPGWQLSLRPSYKHFIKAFAVAFPAAPSGSGAAEVGQTQLQACSWPAHTPQLNEISDLERQVVGHLYEVLLLIFHS